jgi:hypothetical protein
MNKNKIVPESSKIDQLIKDNPTVPSEIYDIEASQEMADLWVDMFGY